MTELVIKSQQGKDVTTSLIVAEVFGKEHKNVLRDIETLSCSAEFNRLNFELIDYTDSRGRQQKSYEITKDGFSFLVMGYTGEKAGQFKEAFINEFNKREMMLMSDDYILARSQEILRTRLELAEERAKELEAETRAQSKMLEEQAPKVTFANAMLASKTSCLVGELAKILTQNGYTTGQKRLFKWLRRNGYLGTFGENYNIPQQRYMEQGLFELKKGIRTDADGVLHTTVTVKITPKGQSYFINKYADWSAQQDLRPVVDAINSKQKQ